MKSKSLSADVLKSLRGGLREPENMSGQRILPETEPQERRIFTPDSGVGFMRETDVSKWPATPRYILAELNRAGVVGDVIRRAVWIAWVNSTDVGAERIGAGAGEVA